ncbi:trypsin-like peptidase domain-containing protein [Micromonospora sp. NPDC047527]|uniref:S1C family serine protease n=1 Tax=Micromonospora sp. NPDC047527 TaxID=3155144 RepID=UPI0034003380
MTEFESDPQRRPAPTDAEPSHPTAELPRDVRAQSDSPTTPVPTSGDAENTTATPAPADAPAPTPGYAGQPTGYEPPTATPSATPYPVSGHPAHGQLGYPQQPAGQYPAAAWYAGQQSGWASGGQPGMAYQQHAQHQQHQQHPGQPVPPWGPQVTPPGTGPRPGRIAKFVGAGVAVFALMLGSGVAGGALALALDGDNGVTRTYTAAPVLNSADLPKIAAAVQDSVVSIATNSGEGSGVVLSADGYVLTNNHVVASAAGDMVQVVFADGKNAQAKIVGTDPKTDLAVVKANGVSDLKPATFGDSDAMQVGDQVLALGSPLGLQGSVTAGIVSARDRTIRAGDNQQPQDPSQQGQAVSSISGLLQTDAPINPGNSGGALVNTRGEVIGVNTAIATSGQSTGNIGVGFAIPSNKAKDVAGKLQRGEKVSHPSLGVGVNQAEGGGALVASVTPGSPADKAGLQRGDVVTRFGDKAVNDSDDLVGAVQAGKVGDRVEVQFKRNGTEKSATVTLAETS